MILFQKKSSNILTLALLSVSNGKTSYSGAAAEQLGLGKGNVQDIATSVAQSFHLGDSSRVIGKETKTSDADSQYAGEECVPEAKRKLLERIRRLSKSRAQRAERKVPDVGVLSKVSAASSCPAPNQVCQADSTSFLGGKCVESVSDQSSTLQETSSDVLGSQRLLQDTGYGIECPSTCTNDAVCGCFSNPDGEECPSVFESLCENEEELESCTDSYYFSTLKYMQCPVISCYSNGGSYEECQCELNSSICDFCGSAEGASSAFCAFSDPMCTTASCCDSAADDTEKKSCLSQYQGYAYGGTMPTGSSAYGGVTFECKDTCTNVAICDCLQDPYGSNCVGDVWLSSCQNDEELSSCLDPLYFSTIKYFQCPLLLCYGNGNGSEECQCELYSSTCDFCTSPEGAVNFSCVLSESMCEVASCCNSALNDEAKAECLAVSNGGSTMPTWASSVMATAAADDGIPTTPSNMDSESVVGVPSTASASSSATTVTGVTTTTSTALASDAATTTASATGTSATPPSSTTPPESSEDDSNTEEASVSEGTVDVATASQENSSGDNVRPFFNMMWAMMLSLGLINA